MSVLTQTPPQRALRGATQSLVHAYPIGASVDGAQTGLGSPHPLLQLPQRNDVVTDVSQPVDWFPEQLSLPGRHAPRTLHAPRSHVTRAGSMPGSRVQSLPQRPQLRTSVSGSAQPASQMILQASLAVGTSAPASVSGAQRLVWYRQRPETQQ